MGQEIRDFYELYFAEMNLSPQEQLKQVERVKLLDRFAKDIGGLIGFGLAVGVGQGSELKIAKDRLVALDLPYACLSKVKRKYPNAMPVQGDGAMLPFKRNTLSWILCSEVIEHTPDRGIMIKEFNRVLKPGGILMLTTPNWFSWFGLSRAVAEFIIRKPIHAGNQPLDEWTTYWRIGVSP